MDSVSLVLLVLLVSTFGFCLPRIGNSDSFVVIAGSTPVFGFECACQNTALTWIESLNECLPTCGAGSCTHPNRQALFQLFIFF